MPQANQAISTSEQQRPTSKHTFKGPQTTGDNGIHSDGFAPTITEICLELDRLRCLIDDCGEYTGLPHSPKPDDSDYDQALPLFHTVRSAERYAKVRLYALYNLLSTLVPSTIAKSS